MERRRPLVAHGKLHGVGAARRIRVARCRSPALQAVAERPVVREFVPVRVGGAGSIERYRNPGDAGVRASRVRHRGAVSLEDGDLGPVTPREDVADVARTDEPRAASDQESSHAKVEVRSENLEARNA